MNVALFGGSFDPPHVGHVLAAVYALSTGPFERVLVVPVLSHAFGKRLVAYEHRVAMTRLALEGIHGAEVSTIESHLGAPSRTLRTVQHLRSAHPEFRLRLLIGADVHLERHEWFGYDELEKLAPPFVLGRLGVENPDAPESVLPSVSSTTVRELLGKGALHPRLADATAPPPPSAGSLRIKGALPPRLADATAPPPPSAGSLRIKGALPPRLADATAPPPPSAGSLRSRSSATLSALGDDGLVDAELLTGTGDARRSGELGRLVPRKVLDYIETHDLYR
jgi:nicotinate-nucleotide adenylyltransferase